MPRAKQGRSKSKAELQRRAGHSQPSQSAPSLAEQGHQKTISDLFSASKQGSNSRIPNVTPGSSPNKRLKTTHPSNQSLDSPHVGSSGMYNFSASSPKTHGGTIDLTQSSKASPVKSKNGGVFRPSTFGSHAGSKKLVVKNLKTLSKPDPNAYFERIWSQLDAALTAIFTEKTLPFSMEELYKGVEFTTRQDKGPILFSRLQEKCEISVRTHVEVEILPKADETDDIGILKLVDWAWARWSKMLKTLHSIFCYLDRAYLFNSTHLPSLQEMGTSQFRENVFENPSLEPSILQGVCNLVELERNGNHTEQNELRIKSAIRMFQNLSVYSKHFESKFLADSEFYFNECASQLEGSNDLAGYVQMSQKLMESEEARSGSLGLEQTTSKTLQTYLEDILIDHRQSRLTQEVDVVQLLANDRQEVLKQLFAMLKKRYLGDKIKQPWDAYINSYGSEIVFDEGNEQKMVPRLLDFKHKLDTILEHCFQKHEVLGHSLRTSFENFINKSKRSNMTWGTDNPKPGEMIAKHVDAILKGGSKAVRSSAVGIEEPLKVGDDEEGDEDVDEDTEITRSLDQVLDLFRFVHGKAVFEAFYKRDLARRLLLARSASSDAEKSMLVRLKSECGAGFTHNLEQMFKDIEMAKEEMKSYRQMLEDQQKQSQFDLNVNILSASAWPSYPAVQVNVPENILLATADFEKQYKAKHTGRRLEWKHALAHCQLKATFPKGNKEIVVSSFQAIVLLAFNGNETIPYSELQAFSGLDDNELQRTLQSLACARFRVLSKSPKGKDVNKGDVFSINNAFTHPKYRIKINQIQARETKSENKETHQQVAADRQFETQAAIVRIMKGRRTISHAELVAEVIQQTKSRGALDPADIKKNIEKLIEKEYMERDGGGENVYHYMA